jgi:hypothetical protein
MKTVLMTLSAMLVVGGQAWSADHDPKAIAALLKDSKISLLQGIERAEKSNGPVTSAKFEISDGKLILSIYTIPEGLDVEPEKATLTELHGIATEAPFKPETEVFQDKEHIARSAVHMTLAQLSPLTLKQIIKKALKQQPGTPIDVRNPMVRGKRPVADVVIIGSDQSVSMVSVDLLSGNAISPK